MRSYKSNTRRCLAPKLLAILVMLLSTAVIVHGDDLYPKQSADSTNQLASRIHALHDRIMETGRYINQLTEQDMASLPVGVVKDVGGIQYIIAIDQARFAPQGAFFNAYISLDLPFTEGKLAFAAENISFHPGGLSASTGTRLVLVEEQKREINEHITLSLPADGQSNYVAWDCDGFREISLKGAFEFSREMILPREESDRQEVRAVFEVLTNDPGNIITAVSISPFRLAKLKDLAFEVKRATVDYSDLANPAAAVFPVSYGQDFGADIALWQGFYLQETVVTLPELLSPKTGSKEIIARNLIIDTRGVTGAFAVNNLFERKDGSLNGWPFSIDSLAITLERNKLAGGGIKGLLDVPIFDPDSPMSYEAVMSQRNGEMDYLFAVQPGRSMNASVLGAEIELSGSSRIIVEKTGGRFKPSAILHGTASISSGSKIEVSELAFENVHLVSESPYVLSGVWALKGKDQKVAQFPVSINNIEFIHNQQRVALNFDVALSLMDKQDKGFSAGTRVNVQAKIEERIEQNGEFTVTKQDWRYDKTEVDDISIQAKGGFFNLEGRLSLYDEDPVYGNGFRGDLKARFRPGPMVQATAQFGTVNDLRYWYVDAKATWAAGAMIAPGVGFYGMGGGLYYRMGMQRFNRDELANSTVSGQPGNQVGATSSGLVYVPDAETGLGFKAGVTLGTFPSPHAFNSDVTFEVAFNQHGGLRYILFRGEGYFMQPVTDRVNQPSLYAETAISYDFENDILHANLDVYVNVAGILRGVNPNDLAGSAVLHFAPSEWYIHIGTPSQRVGLNFVGLVETGAYFMVGDNIPAMPTPPANVSEILGGMDLDFMRQENALGNGSGVAFGSSMQFNTGKMQFLVFYAEFAAGTGFDVMLKNYGNAFCAGETDRIGINGWYASGQAWAYFQGAIGIKVRMRFIQGEFEILRIGAAAILQAKLPNPLYMRGVVGGKFSILGGLVKGQCRFKVTIGEECEIVGLSSVTGVKAIAEITPSPNEEVSVFATPQAAFNLTVGQEHEILNANQELKAYRIQLNHFKVTYKGQEIAGDLAWNEAGDVAVFKSLEILPPASGLRAEVKVTWEERVDGRWVPLESGGQQESEVETTNFITGEAPINIPEENVAYTYPVKGQYNFLKKEHAEGYVQLGVGQAYLFENDGDTRWNHVARFEAPTQPNPVDVPMRYDRQSRRVAFNIPDALANETVWQLHLLKLPADQETALFDNVQVADQQVIEDDGTSVSVASKEITGTLSLPAEFRLYHTHFRTSRYNTFNEKLAAVSNSRSWAVLVENHRVLKLGYAFDSDERFDKADFEGGKDDHPLLQLEVMTGNPWYQDFAGPVVYNSYPVNSDITIADWREEQPFGVPPLRSMILYQAHRDQAVKEDDRVAPTQPGTAYFNYDMEYITLMDYLELRDKAWNKYVDKFYSAPPAARKLMTTDYLFLLPQTNYRFKLHYVLPGNIRKSTKIYTIEN